MNDLWCFLKRQRFLMDPSNPQESDYGVWVNFYVQDNLQKLSGYAMKRLCSLKKIKLNLLLQKIKTKVLTLQLIKERGIQPWTSGGSKYSDETKRWLKRVVIESTKIKSSW